MLNRRLLLVLALASLVTVLLLTYARLDARFGGFCAGEGGCLKVSSDLKDKNSPTSPPAATQTPEGEWGRPVATDGEQRPKFVNQADKVACKDFPDTSNILLVMKTGASEAYSKIPTQAVTMLRCLPDYLVFSDMEQTVAGQHILDSLDTVLPEAQDGNHDFDLYRRQRDCPVDQETCNKGEDAAKEGWALDKYKNIHMAEKSYASRPDYDWYLFVDADSYVFWSNMVTWLKDIDSKKKHYLGSAAMLGGFPFAHGGSGYLMSSGLMKAMFGGKEGVANEWDQEAPKTCCGDFLLARAVQNYTAVRVKNVWPTINGEKPHTLQYDSHQWCQPIATMHHLTAEEVFSIWTFEQRRGFDAEPMRFKDLYQEFLSPHLQTRRDDWDNLASDLIYINNTAAAERKALEEAKEEIDDKKYLKFEDWEIEKSVKKFWKLSEDEEVAYLSADNCEKACATMSDCMQWKYKTGLCTLDKRASMGRPLKEKDEKKKLKSGWIADRIREWAEKEECHGNVKWPSP
ncbi:hypothetical protein NLU13_3525 [Sarocladium strictum]|uniref:Glycosyltransferase family 31 protein n=1 Tax=Sarocladium strictum TaxID=5046 RepID=A0AA39GPX7_SARSR|nr:hypothetical protein NLU13_3525 [Sarocladium strictum]